ncbi:hypothetical protein [Paraburkholderia domus]|uniref:hypothetical protein n=1 Tax=Paraburkholderia domus TaxID=2793075 RepID=UPI001B1F9D64|nr:hypothetical protein [Paraburkholderia domus]CAE6797073.1 hypothetical protein R75483_05163 [Paraburkholderia domus]
MRMFIAALLSAAALLPSLAHATAPPSDPADASASVPAVNMPSAFAGYQPYRDQKAPTWQALNRAVTSAPAMKGMSHGNPPASSSDANYDEHSAKHGGPAK